VKIRIRPAVMSDTEACGCILYEVFKDIADRHRFPPDLPSVEQAIRIVAECIKHPSTFGVVAERHGRVVGSGFMDERDQIYGIGPVSVKRKLQGRGVGRKLMEPLLERSKDALGVRLIQDSFNAVSISLYASLGFEVKEPLALLEGRSKSQPPGDIKVRALKKEDLAECDALCRSVHGITRTNELLDALNLSSAFVLLRGDRITAYTSGVTFWGHAVAETREDMQALFSCLGVFVPEKMGFIVPIRLTRFFHWCLREGFRVVKPMTLMAMGQYQDPKGCYLPSGNY